MSSEVQYTSTMVTVPDLGTTKIRIPLQIHSTCHHITMSTTVCLAREAIQDLPTYVQLSLSASIGGPPSGLSIRRLRS